eukprot:3938904-Rhodomonas_salina.1
MFSWNDQMVNAAFGIVAEPLVRLRFLGLDSEGQPVLAARSSENINSTALFPIGKQLQLAPKRAVATEPVYVEVKAFEYGYYKDISEFLQRQVQGARTRGAHVGILTCACEGTI